jgi:hypothetical protein
MSREARVPRAYAAWQSECRPCRGFLQRAPAPFGFSSAAAPDARECGSVDERGKLILFISRICG